MNSIHKEIQSFFPQGIVLDLASNNYNLFLEFPTVDGKTASVCIYDEGVVLYTKNGQYVTKEQYAEMVDNRWGVPNGDESVMYEVYIYGEYAGDVSHIFNQSTLIKIGRQWSKFNRSYSIAMGL